MHPRNSPWEDWETRAWLCYARQSERPWLVGMTAVQPLTALTPAVRFRVYHRRRHNEHRPAFLAPSAPSPVSRPALEHRLVALFAD